ncbi:MAG: FmdB family zinc ribbon protein [Actinomycetota bacterium]
MPTYEYRCRDCGHTFDVIQAMIDDPLTVCPVCSGELRKVFAPPAISFKGSGFYATDHGKKSKSSGEKSGERSGEKTGEKTAAFTESSDSKSEKKDKSGSSKPAEKTAASSSSGGSSSSTSSSDGKKGS